MIYDIGGNDKYQFVTSAVGHGAILPDKVMTCKAKQSLFTPSAAEP